MTVARQKAESPLASSAYAPVLADLRASVRATRVNTLQTMLLQTHAQRIFLLPAWPKEWNVEFKLHAPRQTVIEGVYRDGKVQSLRVTPESRRADVTMPR